MSAQSSRQDRHTARWLAIWLAVIVLAVVMLFMFGRYGINPNRWAEHVLSQYPG